MNFEYTFPPTDQREIENLEEKYNIKLPDEYRQFLLLNIGRKEDLLQMMPGKKVLSSLLLYCFFL
ncbi:SMI1/KNR4 family protein [Bacillus pseudomycoides]|uniref:SMI1/KNR4 family protein n=1 Tax=Bacillus pseudomycoides TaxID=64104 RepID=UPI00211D70E5|nr:SMI1/KNR4 family protein [Bacillus pseudomycoides]